MEGDVVLLAEQVLHHTQECSGQYCPTASPCLLPRGPSVGLVEVLASAIWQPRPLR